MGGGRAALGYERKCCAESTKASTGNFWLGKYLKPASTLSKVVVSRASSRDVPHVKFIKDVEDTTNQNVGSRTCC